MEMSPVRAGMTPTRKQELLRSHCFLTQRAGHRCRNPHTSQGFKVGPLPKCELLQPRISICKWPARYALIPSFLFCFQSRAPGLTPPNPSSLLMPVQQKTFRKSHEPFQMCLPTSCLSNGSHVGRVSRCSRQLSSQGLSVRERDSESSPGLIPIYDLTFMYIINITPHHHLPKAKSLLFLIYTLLSNFVFQISLETAQFHQEQEQSNLIFFWNNT